MRFFIHGFHCQMESIKNPKGRRAKNEAPLGWRRRRRFVVFHVAVETVNKKPHGNQFLIKVRPNIWPRIDNRLWVALALNRKYCFPPFLLRRDHYPSSFTERSDFLKGPKGPLGAPVDCSPLGSPHSEFSRFAPGPMPIIPQNGRLHLVFHTQNLPKWSAMPERSD